MMKIILSERLCLDAMISMHFEGLEEGHRNQAEDREDGGGRNIWTNTKLCKYPATFCKIHALAEGSLPKLL